MPSKSGHAFRGGGFAEKPGTTHHLSDYLCPKIYTHTHTYSRPSIIGTFWDQKHRAICRCYRGDLSNKTTTSWNRIYRANYISRWHHVSKVYYCTYIHELQGDSGGPLMQKKKNKEGRLEVVGVLSKGMSCLNREFLSDVGLDYFTNVMHHLKKFILKTIRK